MTWGAKVLIFVCFHLLWSHSLSHSSLFSLTVNYTFLTSSPFCHPHLLSLDFQSPPRFYPFRSPSRSLIAIPPPPPFLPSSPHYPQFPFLHSRHSELFSMSSARSQRQLITEHRAGGTCSAFRSALSLHFAINPFHTKSHHHNHPPLHHTLFLHLNSLLFLYPCLCPHLCTSIFQLDFSFYFQSLSFHFQHSLHILQTLILIQ